LFGILEFEDFSLMQFENIKTIKIVALPFINKTKEMHYE
jgi:hypothetical protein